MRTRIHRWIDTKKLWEMFGVQVQIDGVWHHCKTGGKPCIYKTREQAERKRASLKKMDQRSNHQPSTAQRSRT